jgi:SAM-dependent methyltransferase
MEILKKLLVNLDNLISSLLFIDVFSINSKKWGEIPGSKSERINSSKVLEYSDEKLLNYYYEVTSQDNSYRGWYRNSYAGQVENKKVLDLGCGLGRDGIFFLENKADVTFADINLNNILLVEKICKAKNLKAKYKYLKSYSDFEDLIKFDYIFAIGSLINNPKRITKKIVRILLNNNPKVRFVFLGYPKARWLNDGKKSFRTWGLSTDGGAPWIEYYDLKKINYVFDKKYSQIKETNYQNEFNLFEIDAL